MPSRVPSRVSTAPRPFGACTGSKGRNRASVARASKRPQQPEERRQRGRTLHRLGSVSTSTENDVSVTSKEAAVDGPSTSKSRSPSPKSRVKAVAAKISAARELARRLAEEKQAAVAQGFGDSSVHAKRAAEAASAVAAAEAAQADALARAMSRAQKGLTKELEVQRWKGLSQALSKLCLELAQDPETAQAKIAETEQHFAELEVEESEEKESRDVAASVATDLQEEDIVNVFTQLAVAKEMQTVQATAAVEEAPPRAVPEIDQEEILLQNTAQSAQQSKKNMFTFPLGPSQVGKPTKVYYNRAMGPLSEAGDLVLKYGANKWEEIQELHMQRCDKLSGLDGADWWEVGVDLPDDLFRFEFVIFDRSSGAVDNNEAMDFKLELKGGPTEEELIERRLEMFEDWERKRELNLEREIKAFRKETDLKAEAAAISARSAYHTEREAELMEIVKQSVGERRAQAVKSLGMAYSRQDGHFAWYEKLLPGGKCLLTYNKQCGPLIDASEVVVHLGMDNWWQRDVQVLSLEPLSKHTMAKYQLQNTPGSVDWWGVWIDIPMTAAVVNFVFEDGEERLWDNNNNNDFHTAVEDPTSMEQLEKDAFESLKAKTSVQDRLAEDQIGVAAAKKVQRKAESYIRRWRAQTQFLYTEPLRPKAGQSVSVYYRPDITVLRGRPDVFLRGSYNRWRHNQCFTPQKMVPTIPGGVGYLTATVDIPADAHVMDLVFSDTGDLHGGFYDNNNGLDYHIPVEDGQGELEPLRVVHVTVEMAPIAKVGGLGDVVTALGRAVQEEGHNVEVIMPKYDVIDYDRVETLEKTRGFHFGGTYVQGWKGKVEGLEVTFLEPENGMFWTGCIYGREDDYDRFGFFCQSALEYLKVFNIAPDIVHCHDWQTAPVAFGERVNSKCAFTIHNLNYGAELIGKAMNACEVATTVSPTYATEVSGNPAVAPHLPKFYGIRNGIDEDVWDPAKDKFLPANYSADNFEDGKAGVQRALREKLGLAQMDVPIVGVVTRLTPQKGIHLIKHAAWRTLERGGQFVLLGSAPDPAIQHDFDVLATDLSHQYPDRVKLWFEYNEPLSHLIYAGSDIFLVPSMFEPCGLTQMIAMRYGAVPVVRRTGGLNDTVMDVDNDEDKAADLGMVTNGFNFDGADAGGIDYALNRALSAWYSDRAGWNRLVKRVMSQDWSWSLPALDYLELYYKALK